MTNDTQEPHGLGWGYVIYQQIVGILGALALLSFIGNFVDFDWRGAVRSLMDVWDATVRPAMKLVTDVTVVPLLKALFKFEFEVPVIVRDYLAVGLVLFAGSFRAAHAEARRQGLSTGEFFRNLFTRYLGRFVAFFGMSLTIWPVIVVDVLFAVATGIPVKLFHVTFERARWRGTIYMLSAAIWLAVLWIANQLLPYQ